MLELNALLELKGPSLFTDDVFTRKGHVKIAADTIIKKKFDSLRKADQTAFNSIKTK